MKILNTLPWLLSCTDPNVNCAETHFGGGVICTSLPVGCHYSVDYYWASVSENHTSAFNVKFCLYGTYVGPYAMAGAAGAASPDSHSYCGPLLPPLMYSLTLEHICLMKSQNGVGQYRYTSWATLTDGVGKNGYWDQDERATALHLLCVATSLMLAPQCSTST